MDDTGPGQEIDAALAAGDVHRACAIAERALAGGAGLDDPLLYNLAAWQCVHDGAFEAAHAWLQRGLAIAPGDPGLLTTLGLALRRQGRIGEALATLDGVVALAPAYAAAWAERGFALDHGGSLRLAEASYRRAADLDPGSAAALARVASIAARQGDAETGRDFASRALAIDPGDIMAGLALARSDIALARGDATGGAAAAVDRLGGLLARSDIGADDRIAALSLFGTALDRLGDSDAAYAAFAASNTAFAVRYTPADNTRETHRRFVERIDHAVAARDAAAWHGPADREARCGHAFLLGYPRSGTTLVENILASVPGVAVLEERPTLRDADLAFLGPSDGLARLARLDAAGFAEYRAAYWRRVADFGGDTAARLFVDMDPLKGLKLPLILPLFPAAHIIVMRRDPRDVVWSCFRQDFAASAAALDFTSLDDTARHYDAFMRLQEHCLVASGRPSLTLRYETLVADFDAETRRLCEFLGLAWTPAVRDFSTTARHREIATASVGQVRQGLYDGAGQWRRYARQLEPVLAVLTPWIELFGYRT